MFQTENQRQKLRSTIIKRCYDDEIYTEMSVYAKLECLQLTTTIMTATLI